MSFEHIPEELRRLAQWVCWRLEIRDGKPTKVPYQADGSKADSSDPSTWMPFADAELLAGDYDGIGFVFAAGDPYCGFDIDDLAGADDERLRFARMLHSYTERSHSGSGMHVICKAGKPGDRCKNTTLKVELYDRNRFFVMTGDVVDSYPSTIESRRQEVDDLYALLFPQPAKNTAAQTLQPSADIPTDDDELWKRMFASKHGRHIESLYNGHLNGYAEDHSAADMALMNHLAFWTGKDAARMERMFIQSGLGRRDKWTQREDYRQRTIAEAIAGTSEAYTPARQSQNGADKDKLAEAISTDFLRTETLDDCGNSNCVHRLHGDKFAYTDNFGWLHWTGTHWKREGAEAAAKTATRDTLIQRRVAVVKADEDGSIKTGGVKPSSTNIRNCLYQFQPLVTTCGSNFDREPHLLNVKNGVVDLRTGVMAAHEPSNRFTYCVPVDYVPGTDAGLWESTLLNILDGDIDRVSYLKRALGYSVTGETREECLFYLYGQNGRNGKGTIVNTVLELLGYPLGQATSFDTFSNKRNDPQGFLLAPLHNARMIAASESNRAERLNEAVVKMLTGRDSFQASFKGKTPFVMTPTFKVWLMSNYPIRGDVDDNAFWYRFRLIELTKSYQGSENKALKGALLSTESRQGILSWLVQGAMQWYRNGLGEPDTIWDAVRRQRDEQDYTLQFIGEGLTESADGSNLDEVYQVYKVWCDDNGLRSTSKAYLSRNLRAKSVEIVRAGKHPNRWQKVEGYAIHPDYTSKTVSFGNLVPGTK